MMFSPGPIIAKSTGEGSAALAVIRISGFKNISDFNSSFSKKLDSLKPRVASLVALLDKDKLLDEVVATFFQAPHSYTGENILELSVHGNPINVDRIIEFFCDHYSCRLAQPGEFTYRALKNKKMDLSQVESLDMLLTSKSLQGVELGLKGLNGTIHSCYLTLREEFIKLRILVELLIDFSEDVGEVETQEKALSQFSHLKKLIDNLHSRVTYQSRSLLSPSIVLFGTPNSGKSTFFNYLLGHERSIVSSEAGTTRDYVSETLQIEHRLFNLIDTAGIRESQNAIEKQGIERSFEQYREAFFKIAVINPLDYDDHFLHLLSAHSVDCFVITHFDKFIGSTLSKSTFLEFISQQKKPLFLSRGPIEPLFFGPIEPLFFTGPIEPVFASGPIEPLSLFFNLISQKLDSALGNDPILVPRQQAAIKAINDSINNMDIKMIYSDILICSNEINILGSKIEALVGLVSADDVLNNLFSNFCIGK
ncbi:MAG: hypothetical protein COW00_05800 [Bdellovibrio sp. CG12_big_fil_rev_8_21_14_0_65_39_13]|nr:MAG: hypothetical protein COW78_18335 [Bdellovibrio sp. CG22_combo_CG10-13_8_21_14_all_39_27]PIQ60745.1 MAG: hypothetical protein COW00_05800 [Bdellovibrio sp. CG12_big_fil_rev_8_21_14_0_65_39_13]PIR36369.1 MAG: hypothetical protein COV37_03135 [Bdellovibrio sp. CG11_big_fil_rev_8_21_14_0_20_39_38]